MKRITIAVDGHSSCGKSTMARELAAHFNYRYIDSGAMYRAVALYVLRNDLIHKGQVDEKALLSRLRNIELGFSFNPLVGKCDIYLNGANVEDQIRSMEVSNIVSQVATIQKVRQALVLQQQNIGKDKGVVMDGRDIGTVVFPNAELKIFMTASPEVRAKRRYDELLAKGQGVTFKEVLENVQQRDLIDSSRKHSPLLKANDAIELDNSNLNQKEQLAWAIEKVNELING